MPAVKTILEDFLKSSFCTQPWMCQKIAEFKNNCLLESRNFAYKCPVTSFCEGFLVFLVPGFCMHSKMFPEIPYSSYETHLWEILKQFAAWNFVFWISSRRFQDFLVPRFWAHPRMFSEVPWSMVIEIANSYFPLETLLTNSQPGSLGAIEKIPGSPSA